MSDRLLPILIATLTVLLVAAVLWGTFAPARRPEPQVSTLSREPVRGTPAPPIDVQHTPQAPDSPAHDMSYFDQLAHAEARRRIRSSVGYTYLDEIVAVSGDSTLRRWDARYGRPVRVYLPAGAVEHFQPSFLDAIRRAFAEWADAGVPLQFNLDADSMNAEVQFRWTLRFGIDRTGQTDLTWDSEGHVVSAVVTVATLDPKGSPLGPDDIRVVALHEIGHVLGLDHSSDSTDIMFANTKARDLSGRDIRTMTLLYQLAAGSLR